MTDRELMSFLKEEFGKINQRFDEFDQKFTKRFDRLEKSQQEDIITVLRTINKKTEYIPNDIEYLRNITSKHDMEIDRIKKRIGN